MSDSRYVDGSQWPVLMNKRYFKNCVNNKLYVSQHLENILEKMVLFLAVTLHSDVLFARAATFPDVKIKISFF